MWGRVGVAIIGIRSPNRHCIGIPSRTRRHHPPQGHSPPPDTTAQTPPPLHHSHPPPVPHVNNPPGLATSPSPSIPQWAIRLCKTRKCRLCCRFFCLTDTSSMRMSSFVNWWMMVGVRMRMMIGSW